MLTEYEIRTNEIRNETLLRIALSLERLIELKEKPRQKRNAAPSEYSPAFIEAWNAYPKRNGSNSKAGAFKAWDARVKLSRNSEDEMALMLRGVKRYAAWCEATNKTGTEVVMQASRFFGPQHEYQNAWDVPPTTVQSVRIPYDVNELVKFAASYGIEANVGESPRDFRQRVENNIAQ